MAYKGTGVTFNEYFEATANSKPDIFIEEWLKPAMVEVFMEESNFAKELQKAGVVASLAPSWQTQRGYPDRLTATLTTGDGATGTLVFSGTFNGEAIDATKLAQVLRKGSVCHRMGASGAFVQAKITQAAPIASLTATVAAHGGTTLVSDTDGSVDYFLMAPSWADNRSIEQPTSLPRKREHTFTQIFRGEVEILDTDENLDEKLVTNPLERQLEMVLRRMAQEKAMAFILGRPITEDGGTTWLTGYDDAEPYMAGVLWWAMQYAQDQESNPLIYIDCENQPLTEKMLKNLGHNLRLTEYAKIGSSGYQVWGNPTTMRYKERFQEAFRRTDAKTKVVGFDNEAIMIEGAEIPFKDDQYFPESIVCLAPMSQLSYGPFKNGTKRKWVETDDFSKQCMIKEHIYGLLPENPRHIGILYNVLPYSD